METSAIEVVSRSADVRIHLHIDGEALPVAQLGPDFLILRTPIAHPPCDAEIAMSIDGHEQRWGVHWSMGFADTVKTTIG